MEESGNVDAKYRITKFDSQESYEKEDPSEVSEFEENVFLNEGIDQIFKLAIGSAVTSFGSANAYIGVGNDSTSESSSQTGLQGGSAGYQAMMSGYPSLGSQNVIFKSEFGSTDANFSWEELTVANGSSNSATNWNRKVSSQGTKTSGSIWQVEITLSIS